LSYETVTMYLGNDAGDYQSLTFYSEHGKLTVTHEEDKTNSQIVEAIRSMVAAA